MPLYKIVGEIRQGWDIVAGVSELEKKVCDDKKIRAACPENWSIVDKHALKTLPEFLLRTYKLIVKHKGTPEDAKFHVELNYGHILDPDSIRYVPRMKE